MRKSCVNFGVGRRVLDRLRSHPLEKCCCRGLFAARYRLPAFYKYTDGCLDPTVVGIVVYVCTYCTVQYSTVPVYYGLLGNRARNLTALVFQRFRPSMGSL